MKSPDRDAAEFGAALAWKQRFEAAQATASEYLEAIDQQAAELATLRRRVAEMEEALRAIAGQSVYEDDDYRIQLQDTIDAAREVATAALSPPTRKE